MKDLYTFDTDKDSATRTYEEVNDIYGKLFTFLGVPYEKGIEIRLNWLIVIGSLLNLSISGNLFL